MGAVFALIAFAVVFMVIKGAAAGGGSNYDSLVASGVPARGILLQVANTGMKVGSVSRRFELRQDGDVTTHAVAVLAAPRELADPLTWCALAPPVAPSWRTIEPVRPGAWPEFGQHFEWRIVTGVPFSGGEPETIGWVRARAPGDARDAAYLAALIDVWFPAVLVRMPAMRPMATTAYELEIVELPTGDAPLLYRGRVDVARDGYYFERRELWTDDGRLLAINHQTFTVIK